MTCIKNSLKIRSKNYLRISFYPLFMIRYNIDPLIKKLKYTCELLASKIHF